MICKRRYIKQPGDTLAGSDAGDQYTGLDRFGRVVDQNWVKLDSPTTSVDRIQYGYDNDSNVLYRNDLVNTTDSQVYTYDALNRLTGFTQGTINGTRNGITGSPTDSGTYTLDSVGNMTTFGSGSRTVNAQNELTSGPYTPGYDADGNLTSGLPAVAAGSPVSLSLVYDAWNDVVGIKNVSGVPWESFYYDANGLRYESALSISPNTVTMTTFSASGEALEDDQGSGASEARVTYVWGIPYVNDLVSLDQATGFFPLQVHHEYVQTDANYDVTSIVAYNASLSDAFVYTPYGKLTILTGGSSAADLNFLYQGGRYDSRDQTYLFGARTEAPSLGTWVQKDPAGYVDGADMYGFVSDDPIRLTDAAGLAATSANGWSFARSVDITFIPHGSFTVTPTHVGIDIVDTLTYSGNFKTIDFRQDEAGSSGVTKKTGDYQQSTYNFSTPKGHSGNDIIRAMADPLPGALPFTPFDTGLGGLLGPDALDGLYIRVDHLGPFFPAANTGTFVFTVSMRVRIRAKGTCNKEWVASPWYLMKGSVTVQTKSGLTSGSGSVNIQQIPA